MYYEAIYIDPPWAFETYNAKGNEVMAGRGEEKHYRCMSTDEIMDIPVHDLADQNCALFLWTTGPHIKQAFKVIDYWDFYFKTMAFVWVKGEMHEAIPPKKDPIAFANEIADISVGKNIPLKNKYKTDVRFEFGQGYWTRANAEFCLLATRGTPKRKSASVSQIVFEPTREHSRKPDIIRDKIVELMGDVSRIELFARQRVEGWDSWGDEVESDWELTESNIGLPKFKKVIR
jgi:N6-adenosine-specific RNA methylase IME4